MTNVNYGHSCTVPAVPGKSALELKGISFQYPGADDSCLEGISLSVQPGEMVALVGPNGAGKSTLIKMIAGQEKIQRGEMAIYGNPVGACHHRVTYVPQRSDIDWRFPVRVRDVVMMGRYAHLGWLRWPGQADQEAVDRALEAMEINDLKDKQVGELSGGQQQRVMLARTLAHEADLILLDEPLNNLDMPTQELIFHVLVEQAQHGKTVLVTTHDLGILPIHFSRAVFLDKRVIADGPVNSVLTAETLAKAYGVKLCIEDVLPHIEHRSEAVPG